MQDSQAWLEMDERTTTERILIKMTDPRYIEQRQRQKQEQGRIDTIVNKHSL